MCNETSDSLTDWLLTDSNSARNNLCGRKGSPLGIHYVVTLTLVVGEQAVVWIASPRERLPPAIMHLPINRVRFPGGQMERLRLVSTWNAFHAWASLRKSLCDGPGVCGGQGQEGNCEWQKGEESEGGKEPGKLGRLWNLKHINLLEWLVSRRRNKFVVKASFIYFNNQQREINSA